MQKKELAIVVIFKWMIMLAAAYGIGRMVYAVTGSGELGAVALFCVLVGYAMYDTPTNTKP